MQTLIFSTMTKGNQANALTVKQIHIFFFNIKLLELKKKR